MSATSNFPVQVVTQPAPVPKGLQYTFVLFAVLGVIGMAVGALSDPTRAWQAYLVNFLFWFAIGVGGVLFGCVIYMANGRWGRNVKRVADGLGAFLPVSFVLFLIMIPFLGHVIPWFEHPWAKTDWQKMWLAPDFLVLRDAAAIAVLTLLGGYILYKTLRVDLGYVNSEKGGKFDGPIHRRITGGWKGTAVEAASAKKIVGILSPIYAILFAVLLTILSMDLIMSLKAGFYSTLIGGYYFAGCFYVALAFMLIAVVWTRKRFDLGDSIRSNHLHDIAKLTMAFGIVTGDFFYGQLLVIWYGNIPHETGFLIDRWVGTPWRWIAILCLVFCFVWPIVWMIKRSVKEKSLPVIVFAVVVLTAMWTLRMFEIAPSVTGDLLLTSFSLIEILVTLGFLGIVGLTFITFMHRVPPVAVYDPILDAPPASED